MRIRSGVVLVVAIVLVVVAGCGGLGGDSDPVGTQKKSGPITLAVVPKAVGFEFWKQVRLGAECAASK